MLGKILCLHEMKTLSFLFNARSSYYWGIERIEFLQFMIVCCFAWTVYATHRRCMILTLYFEVRQMWKKDYDIHRISQRGRKICWQFLKKVYINAKQGTLMSRDFILVCGPVPLFLHRKRHWQFGTNMQCMVLEIRLYGHILPCSR